MTTKAKQILEKEKEKSDYDADHDRTSSFEQIMDKLHDKIGNRPVTVRAHMYKSLLDSFLKSLAGSGSNRTRLTAVAKEYLKEFQKHTKD